MFVLDFIREHQLNIMLSLGNVCGAVALSTDFLRRDTATDVEVSVSFFVWQLLFTAVRLGVVYLLHLLKNTKDKETV